MALVEINQLTFSYDGTFNVLSEINFAMANGQSLLVIGDNGSGKTTLGRVLAGLEKPTTGTITIAGEAPGDLEVRKRCRRVSYMEQVTHLSILTSSIVGELASFSLGAQPSVAEEVYQHWALRHSLPTNTSMNPRDLTAPDLWRLVLVLYAVILQPDLLVVDEVFCPSSKRQQDCAREVLELRKHQGKATVFLYQRGLAFPFDATATLNNNKLSLVPLI
jgi:ABC-type Mn2+/Zn2+ transport system ATPase subunit